MNIICYSLTSFLFVFSILSYGQNVDQLKIQNLNKKAIEFISINKDSACNCAKTAHELNNGRFVTDEAKNLLMVGRCLQWDGKVDSAYHIYGDLIKFFTKNDMQKELGIAYWYTGKVWYGLKQYDKAIPIYLKSAEVLEKSGNYDLQLKVINGLGILTYIKGDLLGGLVYFKKALEIVRREGFQDREFRIIDNISTLYMRLNEYDKALEYNQRALEVYDSTKNKDFLIVVFNNRAGIYQEMGKLDSSLFYLNKSIAVSNQNYGDKVSTLFKKVSSLNSMSKVYIKQKKFRKAINCLREILNSSDQRVIKHKHFIKLSQAYQSIQKLDSAIYFGQESYNLAKEKNLIGLIGQSAKLLAGIYEKKRNFTLANQYLIEYVAYKDSIFNDTNEKKFTDLRVQIETIDKVNEINLLKSKAEVDELKRAAIIRNSAFTIITLVFVIVLILIIQIYFRRINKKKQELKQAKLEAEVEKGQQDLYKQTLHMIHVNNTLDSLEGKVKDAITYKNSDNSYNDILHTIKINKSLEKDWENFNRYFHNSHSDFYKRLSSHETKFSNHEKRVCALIKLNLSNREIATILNIEPKSVAMLKYRLKKKIGLNEEIDIGSYIQTL